MGSVKYTATNELIYKNMTLSDFNVVKYLLINRYDIDKYFNEKQNNHFNEAGIVGDVNQELISLLSSLDLILKEINKTDRQKSVLNLLQKGFTLTEIGTAEELNVNRKNAEKSINSLCSKIVARNNKEWVRYMKGFTQDENS